MALLVRQGHKVNQVYAACRAQQVLVLKAKLGQRGHLVLKGQLVLQVRRAQQAQLVSLAPLAQLV